MKKVAIIQSNYIPWKGYFDVIHDVDVFVFLDDVQMTKRDWRTRNKIKTPRGAEWLTVPVYGGREQLIYEVNIAQTDWQSQHAKTIQSNYSKAPYYKEYQFLLEWLYKTPHTNLSQFNRETTQMICEILGIKTEFHSAMEFGVSGAKDERLINICREVGATLYLSGPAARDYIVEENFRNADITLCYKEYPNYPEYNQLFPPFEHGVSILDVLLNCGPKTSHYIWGWRQEDYVIEVNNGK